MSKKLLREVKMRLENKAAIVTGAASGFGAEIARIFAREGAKVAVLDINGEGAALVATPPMSRNGPTSKAPCAKPWMLSAASTSW